MDILKEIEDLLNSQDFEGATHLMDSNEAACAGSSEYWNMRGIVKYYFGELSAAQACVEKALELDENNLDAYKNLIDILKVRQSSQEQECPEDNDNIVYYDTDQVPVPKPGKTLFESRENMMKNYHDSGAPQVDVDVVVLAYNRLEKTKKCVECILKYTQDVNYQLILVDNGSTDGTFAYFKSVPYKNKLIIKVSKNIGSGFSNYAERPYERAKFFIIVPADVYVTEHWLSNMLKCMQADPKVGIVNPMSSNISNYQNPSLSFTDFDDMQQKAAAFNKSDPHKWQERVRLVLICALCRSTCFDVVGMTDYGFFHDFSDDDLSFRVRRAGYKNILCGDTFVCHDHDVFNGEGKDPNEFQKSLECGRSDFISKHFVDAWTDANNYEHNMLSYVKPAEGKDRFKILGIDVACGTPILEAKNKLRLEGILDTELSAFTTDAKYYFDLKTICGGTVVCDRSPYLSSHFEQQRFDYILLGKPINLYTDCLDLVKKAAALLDDTGHLLLKLRNTYDIFCFSKILSPQTVTNREMPIQVSMELFYFELSKLGLKVKNIIHENYKADQQEKDDLIKRIAGVSADPEFACKRLLVQNFVLDIVKAPVELPTDHLQHLE